MEHSDHWIMTERHREQWDFPNNEKTMEHSDPFFQAQFFTHLKKSPVFDIFIPRNIETTVYFRQGSETKQWNIFTQGLHLYPGPINFLINYVMYDTAFGFC